MVPGTVSRPFLLFVVMSELAHHIVTGSHHGENLLQTVASNKSTCRQSTLCMVGNGDRGIKPARNHLTPTGPRLAFLIHHCGVSTKEDCRSGGVALYLNTTYCGCGSIDFNCQTIIPIEICLLSVFQFHCLLTLSFVGYDNVSWRTFVHDERIVGHLPSLGDGILHHKTSGLGTQHRFCLSLLAPHGDGHFVVSVGHLHGEVLRTIDVHVIGSCLCVGCHGCKAQK